MECKTTKEPLESLKETFIFNNFKTVNKLREAGTFCDLTLVSKDGVEFKVYKIVIYSASGYFKGLFLSGMKESSAERIDLDFITGNTLEQIISFIYDAQLNTDKIEEVEEIAEKSYFLQIQELHEMCLLFLQKLIDESNCLKYWRLAHQWSAEKFEETCIAHIMKFAKHLLDDPLFLNDLTVDEMKKLLSDRRLPLSEECVFKSALKWARDEVKVFHEVIDYIRFPFISKQFLLSEVFTNTTLMQDKKILDKIIECVKLKWSEDLVLTEFTSPQLGSRQKEFLAILDPEIISISSQGSTENLQVKSISRSFFGYTMFSDNLLLICGGSENGEITNSCECFSPNTREWKRFPAMENRKREHECALIDNKIYACGGYGYSDPRHKSEWCKDIEMFDLGTGKWSKGPKMNSTRYRFGLTSLNRSLYAIGGMLNESVEFLDPRSSNGWSTINNEFTPRDYTQSIPVGGDIYCFRRKDYVYIFDTRMNKRRRWEYECPEFQQNEFGGFRVSELNGDFGVIFPKDNCVEFFKYNTKGEIIMKKVLEHRCNVLNYTIRNEKVKMFSCSLSSL